MDERLRNHETGCRDGPTRSFRCQPRMRADTHVGPELNAPLQRPETLMQLSRSSLSKIRLVQRGRAIHVGTFETCPPFLRMSVQWVDRK